MGGGRRAVWVLLGVWLAAAEAAAARRVRVESLNGERTHDAVDTRHGVRLVRQLSRAECRYGDTWGYDRDGIWVDKGCRAEFEVGPPSRSQTATGTEGSGSTGGRVVRVESRNGAYTYKRTDTRGGVQLQRELSRAVCLLSDSWGFDSNGIWVDKGCRGEFQVGGPPAAGGVSLGGSGLRTLRIESKDGSYVHQPADTSGGVRLKRQLSSSECRQGQSWGFDPTGVWVDAGCRAEFELGGGPGRGGSFRRLKLESTSGQRAEAAVDARGGVELLRQLSRVDCIQGRTWGYDRERVWVEGGCRAEFAIYGR